MRRKISQCFRTDDHKIWFAGFSLMTIILSGRIFLGNAVSEKCELDNSVDGLYTLNCSLMNPDGIYLTAHAGDEGTKVVINLEVIYIVPASDKKELAVDILGVPFSRYPLKRIIISRNKIITIRVTGYDFEFLYLGRYRTHVNQIFEDCTYLEYLEVSLSYFPDEIQFRLPKNLKTYNISGNKYSTLQIQGSEALEELNANNNPLRNAPSIIDDLFPPLTTLRLKGCPLQDMTILDLARYCFLTFLELEFSPDNRLLQPEGYCDCITLKQWAKEVLFEIQSLTCYKPKKDEKIACQVQSHIDEAWKIHRKCPLLKRGALTRTIFTVMKYIFLSILFLLLLGTVILYIIRHYHLREWWREHHLHLSKATSIKMEEGEESLRDSESGSSSGKSSLNYKSYLSNKLL